MSAIPQHVLQKLPKAKLISLRWGRGSLWARFRLANAHQFHLGRLTVVVRAPWLEGPARSLYPNLFSHEEDAQERASQ